MADAKPNRKITPKTVKPVAAETTAPVAKAAKPIAKTLDAPAVAALASPARSSVPKPAAKPLESKEIPMTNETFTKPLEAIVPAVEKATADFVAQTQAAQEQMTGKVKEMMEKNMKTMTDMTDFAKSNVEAMIESAKAAAAGAETLTTQFVETSKKSAEEAQAAFKSYSAAKTPNDFINAHNEFAKAQFDKAVANMSHFTETWMKLAGEVVQPLSNRMAVAAETVKKSVAV